MTALPLDFSPEVAAARDAGPLREPRALAVDALGRMFVAECGARQLLVHDLVERRLLRRVNRQLAALRRR